MSNDSNPPVSEISRRSVLRLSAAGAVGLLAAPATAQQSAFVFVYPDDGSNDAAEAVRQNNGTVRFEYENFEFIAARIPEQNLDELREDPRVAEVERDGRVELIPPRQARPPSGMPGGGGGGSCSDHPDEQSSWGWDAVNAGSRANDGNGVDVAILDTGIDADHCDLQNNVQGGTNCNTQGPSWENDKNGHGTHCAGIAAAVDNQIGVVGVAPAADLYGVKVLGPDGSGRWSEVVCGIDWCITNEREVLSMSFGGGYNKSVAAALTKAYDEGHVLVAAAGNSGNNEDSSCSENNVGFPATHDRVIGVSAMDKDGTIASYSSVGDGDKDGDTDVEFIAPGTAIRSTYKDNTYDTLSGTSMACPHVSGVAAIAWKDSGLGDSVESGDGQQVWDRLASTADGDRGCVDGNGLIDASLS